MLLERLEDLCNHNGLLVRLRRNSESRFFVPLVLALYIRQVIQEHLNIIMDYYYEPQQTHSDGASWLSGSNFLTRVMGFSFFASMLQSNSYMVDSVRLFLLGTIIETGRRFCQWLIERFWFRKYTKPF